MLMDADGYLAFWQHAMFALIAQVVCTISPGPGHTYRPSTNTETDKQTRPTQTDIHRGLDSYI